jgi:hypothetical protein
MNKLKNKFKLDNNIRVYVPSTFDVDNKIDNKKQVNKTLKELSNLFGGSTSYNAIGTFISSKKKLIKEDVTICESYCTSKDFKKSINDVVDYCEKLKNEMKQEAVSLEINNELYFI